jgi:hypothetical protein
VAANGEIQRPSSEMRAWRAARLFRHVGRYDNFEGTSSRYRRPWDTRAWCLVAGKLPSAMAGCAPSGSTPYDRVKPHPPRHDERRCGRRQPRGGSFNRHRWQGARAVHAKNIRSRPRHLCRGLVLAACRRPPGTERPQGIFTHPDGARRALASVEQRIFNLDTRIADVVNVIRWEDLNDICLVVHSYGGWIGSGAPEQIGNRV